MIELIDKLDKAKNTLSYLSSIDARQGVLAIEEAMTTLKQSEWIKVEDRLPIVFTTCLVYIKDTDTCDMAIYINPEWLDSSGAQMVGITHWKLVDLTPPTES